MLWAHEQFRLTQVLARVEASRSDQRTRCFCLTRGLAGLAQDHRIGRLQLAPAGGSGIRSGTLLSAGHCPRPYRSPRSVGKAAGAIRGGPSRIVPCHGRARRDPRQAGTPRRCPRAVRPGKTRTPAPQARNAGPSLLHAASHPVGGRDQRLYQGIEGPRSKAGSISLRGARPRLPRDAPASACAYRLRHGADPEAGSNPPAGGKSRSLGRSGSICRSLAGS